MSQYTRRQKKEAEAEEDMVKCIQRSRGRDGWGSPVTDTDGDLSSPDVLRGTGGPMCK